MSTNLETGSIPITFKTLGGGLNTTSGPLGVEDNESTDLQNIDFSKFGSVMERNGYYPLNTTLAAAGSATCQGLYWYTSLTDRYAIMINTGKVLKMDNLDGTWDDISGGVSAKSSGIDDYTKALLHCDGTETSTTFTDEIGKTVTNTATYDSYTVLMLHMEGNLTDSATAKTVTNSGTTFSSTYKFGSSSTSFSTALLSLVDSADWEFGSGDFTIDFWVRFNVVPAATGMEICGQIVDGNNVMYLSRVQGNSLWGFYAQTTALGVIVDMERTSTIVVDTWYHVAIVRNGNSWYMFQDGIQLGTTLTNTNSMPNLVSLLYVGARGDNSRYLNGWIDELRISKGIARWTSNFTSPISAYGQAAITDDTLKFGSGSGVMYGSGEHLEIATSTDFAFGTSDFTIDSWIYPIKSNTAYFSIEDSYNTSGAFSVFSTGSATQVYFNNGSATTLTTFSSTGLTINQWNHLALIKSSSNFYLAVNGIFSGAKAANGTSTGIATNFLRVGYSLLSNSSYYFDGYVDEFRVSKGIARWTTDFTPPTSSGGEYVPIDFDTFLGTVVASGKDVPPFSWIDSNTTASNMTVVTGLTGAKFIKKFQNYLFMANIRLSGIRYPSRVYYSNIYSISTWDTTDWIEISRDDGDEITGLRVLGDRLVVYKNNSIYVILFTSDADIPFIVQKTNSSVGCIAPYSIQDVENGHCFVSQDGIYFFDGFNSYKMSDRINDTFDGLNSSKLENIASMSYKSKNLYWIACSSGTSLSNNMVLTWNSFLNAWSVYSGISASAMATFLVGGNDERPYFADYNGYVYRGDYGSNDYPTNTLTAIDCRYYTNWKHYDDICDKKGIPHVYLVHKNESSTNLTFAYSYDFYNGDQYSSTFSLYTTQTVTSLTTRRDLTGRGRFVRLGFANNSTSTSFRIDGIGTYVSRESKS